MSDGERSPGLCLWLVIVVRAAPRPQLLSKNLDLSAVSNENSVARLKTAFSIIDMCYRAMHTSVLLTEN